MPPLNPWTSKMSGYKAGQNVACRVVGPEPGGYSVLIPKDNLPGFLPTDAKLKPGEEVLAQFVCVSNNRVLLSARLSGATLSNSGSRTRVGRRGFRQGRPSKTPLSPCGRRMSR
jgi:hypothetical protein